MDDIVVKLSFEYTVGNFFLSRHEIPEMLIIRFYPVCGYGFPNASVYRWLPYLQYQITTTTALTLLQDA